MMSHAKDNTENNKSDSAFWWVAGTVITGMLPYLVMLTSWIANEFSKSIWSYYIGLADTAAFMYSVSLCLFLLCVDGSKEIEGGKRKCWIVVSLVAALSSALLYGMKTNSAAKEIESGKNADLPDPRVILASLIMLAITALFVCVGYNLIKEHERKCGEGESKATTDRQEYKQEKSESKNRRVKNETEKKRGKKK